MHVSPFKLSNWLAVHHSPGVGPAKFHNYLQLDPILQNIPIGLQPDWCSVDADLSWLQKNSDAHIITLLDERYPSILKNINNPPPVLYVRGDVSCISKPQIAMVGSRNPTTIGLQQAQYFAKHFASLGFVVTSGLALGIDTASHQGALSVIDGKTIAILGSGLDNIYPWQNKKLAASIIDNGCLVSDFPIGTQPLASNFPRRNRIISGLSLGVLVVEAALNSGSLITARYAADQGREIFAIPGAIHNDKIKGCHQLIRQGAKLVESAEDVLEELAALLKYVIRDKRASSNVSSSEKANLSVLQEQLLNKVDYESTSVDIIVRRSGLAAGIVSAILLELELLGFITVVPGGYARKLG